MCTRAEKKVEKTFDGNGSAVYILQGFASRAERSDIRHLVKCGKDCDSQIWRKRERLYSMKSINTGRVVIKNDEDLVLNLDAR